MFGLAFKLAWNAATPARQALAKKAVETAASAYQATKQAAIEACQAKKSEFRHWVAETADDSLDVAAHTVDASKAAAEKARQVAQVATAKGAAAADRVSKAVGGLSLPAKIAIGPINLAVLGSLARVAASAFRGANTLVAKHPAAALIQPCEHSNDSNEIADAARDGWIMSPQGQLGDDVPCRLIPPGQNSVASAQGKAHTANSNCCAKKIAAGLPPRDIIYVNGIQNTAEDHCKTLKAIAAQTCARVIGVYNATGGKSATGMMKDGLQTAKDRQLVKLAASGGPLMTKDGRNPAVDTLSRAIADGVESGNPPEVWAHSQGGAILSLALMDAKSDLKWTTGSSNPLQHVKVKSFGSAAPVWTDGPQQQHFIHVNDPVPTTLGLGHTATGDAEKVGRGATVIRFSGDPMADTRYVTDSPDTDWLAYKVPKYHNMTQSYLKMEREQNGGCP